MDKIIQLNVGGRRIDTYLKTLVADKSFIHHEAFKSLTDEKANHDLPKDKDGNYFIDDNPDDFLKKLNYARTLVQKEHGSTFKAKAPPSAEEQSPNADKKNAFTFWK
uniref:BTB_2 domain-containing protein n=1 Tax=Strongyloides papillosus TaxID=174720 RepID=A0A0N5BK83_STREA